MLRYLLLPRGIGAHLPQRTVHPAAPGALEARVRLQRALPHVPRLHTVPGTFNLSFLSYVLRRVAYIVLIVFILLCCVCEAAVVRIEG